MRRPTTILCLLALLTGLVSGPALAQQRSGRGAAPARKPPGKPRKRPKEANAPADVPAPYDRDLLRMSEIIGALAFLRNLRGAPDASDWPAA